MCLYVGHCDGIAIIILEFLQENAYSTFSFYMNLRVSNSMKIRRFRWNRNNRNKFIGINNAFTLKFYNWNWLLDVVDGCLLLRSFEALNLEFQVSRSFYFFYRKKAYVYISTYWCCYVLICHSRNTKSNIDYYRKMQKALITTSNGNRLVLQH